MSDKELKELPHDHPEGQGDVLSDRAVYPQSSGGWDTDGQWINWNYPEHLGCPITLPMGLLFPMLHTHTQTYV